MRRPILLFLYVQIFIILVLYYLNPFQMGRFLDRKTTLLSHEGEILSIEGTVTKVSVKDFYNELVIKTAGEKLLVRLSKDVSEQEAYELAGRKINVQGEISIPDARRNPGCFDYRLYLKTQGIYTIMSVSKYRISAGEVKRPLFHILSKAKAAFYEDLRERIGDDEFAITAGLLFGDKSYLEDDLYEEFQKNGIAHVLAVSGLHVGLLYSVIEKLLKGRRRILADTAVLICLYLYACLSSFSVSVLRASLMIFLKILSFYIRKRYDTVTAASLIAILFLFRNPYTLFDSGFQLSFLAAYIIGIVIPWGENKVIKICNKKRSEKLYILLNTITSPVILFVGMAPLIAYHFLSFSPVSLLLNPLAIFVAGLILPSGLICFLLSAFGLAFLNTAASLPLFGLSYVLKLICRLGSLSGLSFSVCAPPPQMMILYYCFFFYFFSETRYALNRKKQQKRLCVLAGLLTVCSIFLPFAFGISESLLPWKYEDRKVTFVDVGQGDCIHIHDRGFDILIDGGGNYYKNIGKETLKPYLLKNGISNIDLAIVTHKDLDHSKGISELAECFEIKEIVNGGNDNESCIICSAKIDDLTFLFMADADIARESALIEKYPSISCDVIKLGHHGSKTSSGEDFISHLNPSFALISCGKNNSYGHPASRVIELLENSGIIYGRTDLYGAISLKRVTESHIEFINAAGDKIWLIPRKQTLSIPQEQ